MPSLLNILLLGGISFGSRQAQAFQNFAFYHSSSTTTQTPSLTQIWATIAENNNDATLSTEIEENSQAILNRMKTLKNEAVEYAEQFGLEPSTEGAFFALFSAIVQEDFIRQQKPFVLRHSDIQEMAWGGDDIHWPGFFGMNHLEKALEDDFLDAARGSTDNRKGWKVCVDDS